MTKQSGRDYLFWTLMRRLPSYANFGVERHPISILPIQGQSPGTCIRHHIFLHFPSFPFFRSFTFTSDSCFWDRWKDKVKSTLLDYGIDSIWNDNNEFEIWDSHARCFAGRIGTLRYFLRGKETSFLISKKNIFLLLDQFRDC